MEHHGGEAVGVALAVVFSGGGDVGDDDGDAEFEGKVEALGSQSSSRALVKERSWPAWVRRGRRSSTSLR